MISYKVFFLISSEIQMKNTSTLSNKEVNTQYTIHKCMPHLMCISGRDELNFVKQRLNIQYC